jgi:UPF0755 protein
MQTKRKYSRKRFFKPGRLVLWCVCIWFLLTVFGSSKEKLHTNILIREGETVAKIYPEIEGRWDRIQLKRFFRAHGEEVAKVQPGGYVFSGSYTRQEILDLFLAWPQTAYEHVTILEGRSSFDIDDALAKAGTIQAGEYRAYITNTANIQSLATKYPFLAQALRDRPNLSSLEGYLYPETYFLDANYPLLPQLVGLQLDAFETRIWEPYGAQLVGFATALQGQWFSFALSSYGALILASIVEKEERSTSNQPAVASVFFNRLQDGMQIDADISLCYGLQKPYASCTPSVIVNYLYDKTNPYNTRAVSGLPPTPIANVPASTIKALLDAKKWSAYFYLHDSEGNLHLWDNISEHNNNKSKYLN